MAFIADTFHLPDPSKPSFDQWKERYAEGLVKHSRSLTIEEARKVMADCGDETYRDAFADGSDPEQCAHEEVSYWDVVDA